MDIDRLKEAYRRTRKDGAVGVTAAEYEQDLEDNLQRLLDRANVGASAGGRLLQSAVVPGRSPPRPEVAHRAPSGNVQRRNQRRRAFAFSALNDGLLGLWTRSRPLG